VSESPRVRAWRLAGALCGVIVALDQGSKAIVTSSLVPGQTVHVLPDLEITYVHNKGVAFGLAGGAGIGVVLLAVAALVLILATFARDPRHRALWIPVGLLAGGALGNLADRVRMDSVIDFIDLPLWPAFNLADIAIVAGVAGLALLSMKHPDPEGDGSA
jgi:signal peptidase II